MLSSSGVYCLSSDIGANRADEYDGYTRLGGFYALIELSKVQKPDIIRFLSSSGGGYLFQFRKSEVLINVRNLIQIELEFVICYRRLNEKKNLNVK